MTIEEEIDALGLPKDSVAIYCAECKSYRAFVEWEFPAIKHRHHIAEFDCD